MFAPISVRPGSKQAKPFRICILQTGGDSATKLAALPTQPRGSESAHGLLVSHKPEDKALLLCNPFSRPKQQLLQGCGAGAIDKQPKRGGCDI